MILMSRSHFADAMLLPPRSRASPVLSHAGAAAIGALCAAAMLYAPALVSNRSLDAQYEPAPPYTSQIDLPPASSAHWIFDSLSPGETKAVVEFVKMKMPAVETDMVGPFRKVDFLSGTSAVELIEPPKNEAQRFLNGEGPAPSRFARVTLVRGTAEPPDVMEYKVGPIFGCGTAGCDTASLETASIEPMLAPGAVPFQKRPYDLSDSAVNNLALGALSELRALLVAATGPVWDIIPDCDECHAPNMGHVQPLPFNDFISSSTDRVTIVRFFWYQSRDQLQAMWLHPLPIHFRFSQPAADASAFRLFDFVFCGQGPFASASAVAAAVESGAIDTCHITPSIGVDGVAGAWDVPGPAVGETGRPGLVPPPPKSRTFSLGSDVGGNNGRSVSWMGWDFFATVRPSTGLAAMDLRFKGKRVAYELAHSEAVAMYSGNAVDQVFYLDSAYSMVQLSGGLMPGVDCPADAAYLNATSWAYFDAPAFSLGSDVSRAFPLRGACIFERVSDATVWRHTQFVDHTPDGAGAPSLVVRAVATVGNYDYITEFEFATDGSVEVSMIFAGYMETRYYLPDGVNNYETKLGAVVHDKLVAPLHSHFANFKVDLDVVGNVNSVQKTETKVGKLAGVPLETTNGEIVTKYVESSILEVEGTAASTCVPDARKPAVWTFINEAERSADLDLAPGYAILPGATVAQALPDDHPFVKAAEFTKYTIAVTKRKDEEARASSVYDLFAPGEPVVSFDSFLDGEAIRHEDLVAWVTIAKEHVPRTEDVPLITNFGTSFGLKPWNMFDKNAGMDVQRSAPVKLATTRLC